MSGGEPVYVYDKRRTTEIAAIICFSIFFLFVAFSIFFAVPIWDLARPLALLGFVGTTAVVNHFRLYRLEFYDDRVLISRRGWEPIPILYELLSVEPLNSAGTFFKFRVNASYTDPGQSTRAVSYSVPNVAISNPGRVALYDWLRSKTSQGSMTEASPVPPSILSSPAPRMPAVQIPIPPALGRYDTLGLGAYILASLIGTIGPIYFWSQYDSHPP